jgi:dTDP-4-amino-4,6-dideoxygalactose transaminase
MTTTRMSIPITRPFIGPEELAAVQRPLESGWLVQGPYVKEFESKFGRFIAADNAVATTSCTTALHLSVVALGLGPGDEVIVPGFTWVATANVVEYMGARPVFVDIDLATFNLDVARLEDAITPKTVGIIPVHMFGLAADMDPIKQIADERRLWTIEDAACGFGAWYGGKHVGTLGDLGCFSFHPRKSITTGEGGMVTTGRDDLAEAVRSLRDHGASRSDLQRHTDAGSYLLADYDRLGYNFRMTDLQGAIGSVQMDRAEWVLSERHRCAEAYDRLLADVEWLALPITPSKSVHGYQSYVCLFQPEEPNLESANRLHERRNRIMARLEAEGIATRQGTHAAFMQGFYSRKYAIPRSDLPRAFLADRLSLSLPMFPGMTEAELNYVATALRSAADA